MKDQPLAFIFIFFLEKIQVDLIPVVVRPVPFPFMPGMFLRDPIERYDLHDHGLRNTDRIPLRIKDDIVLPDLRKMLIRLVKLISAGSPVLIPRLTKAAR